MTTTIVTWMQSNGEEATSRVYTYELAEFAADIESVGGYVMEMHEES